MDRQGAAIADGTYTLTALQREKIQIMRQKLVDYNTNVDCDNP